MMARSAKVLLAAPPAALISVLLAAVAPPPPKATAPPPKAAQHASAEPTEAQLPPVDPKWHQNGWHAVVPHAYVLRGLAPARIRPEPGAPAAFWLKGGVRVPILEQRAQWWRVGWTHGRAGWLPAAELQPHASSVLIDVPTGRVLRRLAAKGEHGSIAAGSFLWSFSDTGITRTSLGEPPAIWSNPARTDPHGSLPEEGIWTPDRSLFFVGANSDEDKGPLVEVSVNTGMALRIGYPDSRLSLARATAGGRLLLTGSSVHLYDARYGREVTRARGDDVLAVARNGAIYARAIDAGGGLEVIRYDPHLKPTTSVRVAKDLSSACLSADERVLALRYGEAGWVELRRADTLARVATLRSGTHDLEAFITAIAGNAGGWWTVLGGDANDGTSVTHYTRQGQRIRKWDSDGPGAMSPDGRYICMARESDLLLVDTTRGTTRRIPFNWRRPLPRQYLPRPSDPDSPTRLEISALTLTPDGRTLILTEWLNGDPET